MDATSLVSLFGQEAGISLALGDAGTVALVFEQGPTLNLEHDKAEDLLHCYVVLGAEPADGARRAELHRELLAANAYGQDTAGATLGLDDSTGEIVLSRRIELARADTAVLRQVIETLVPVAVAWQQRLAGSAEPVGAPLSPAAGIDPLAGFGMRV